jgi:beta-glucosidase
VLLKNDNNVLPLSPATVRSVVVVGDNSTVHGGGSGSVIPPYLVTPTDAIQALLGSSATV